MFHTVQTHNVLHGVPCHDPSCSYAITMFDAWLDNLLYVQKTRGKAFPVNRVCIVSVTNRESHIQLHRLGCGMGRDSMSFHYQSQKQSMCELTRRQKRLCHSYVAARNVKMFHCKHLSQSLLVSRNQDCFKQNQALKCHGGLNSS